MMRRSGCALIVLLAASGAALGAENYIPRGHSYSPDSGGLPPLNSKEDRVNQQTDIYETEIYVRQRERQRFESQFNHFLHDQQPSAGDVLPDY